MFMGAPLGWASHKGRAEGLQAREGAMGTQEFSAKILGDGRGGCYPARRGPMEKTMPLTDPDLWLQIAGHGLPYRTEQDDDAHPPRQCSRFEHNLRKAGDWTEAATWLLVEEYRRFLYLKALDGGDLTPPQCLDEVWHLHLTIDPDNMAALCRTIGRPILHRTGLSDAEALAAYERALALYQREFDGLRPGAVWPSVWRMKIQPLRRGSKA